MIGLIVSSGVADNCPSTGEDESCLSEPEVTEGRDTLWTVPSHTGIQLWAKEPVFRRLLVESCTGVWRVVLLDQGHCPTVIFLSAFQGLPEHQTTVMEDSQEQAE